MVTLRYDSYVTYIPLHDQNLGIPLLVFSLADASFVPLISLYRYPSQHRVHLIFLFCRTPPEQYISSETEVYPYQLVINVTCEI